MSEKLLSRILKSFGRTWEYHHDVIFHYDDETTLEEMSDQEWEKFLDRIDPFWERYF